MSLYRLSLVRAGVPASSAETAQLLAVDGTPIAIVDQAPPLLARMTVANLRQLGGDNTAPHPEVIARAGVLFATADLDGLSPEAYCEMQARSAGIPVRVVRHSLSDIREICAHVGERVAAECPPGAGGDVEPGRIAAVWARRGDILAVVAPSNNPGTHVQWLQGLALGYRLVIRPGTRDPFTPARLVAALLAAGVEPSYLSLLPGGHATGDALIGAADLSLVFGGDEAVGAYAGDRTVILRGPGRSKLLQLGELTDEALETICTSVGYDAGMRCTNASAVFTEGDPRTVGEAIAERLAALVPGKPMSPEAQLPVLPIDRAAALRAHLESRLAGAVDVAAPRYPDGPVADLGDGSAALRPAVLVADRSDHPGGRIELPFPCVWVLPWDRTEGFGPLSHTLVLTILGGDHKLAAEALHEPTIRTVLLGPLPTFSSSPTSPHDGYLGHELMEARGYGVAAVARRHPVTRLRHPRTTTLGGRRPVMSRTIVVTGGGTGIGRAVASAFLADGGDRVVITGRRAQVLEEAAEKLGGDVVPMVCDVTDIEQVEALRDQLSDGVDVLVNNAGGTASFQYPAADDLRTMAEYWQANLNANLMSAVLITTALEKLFSSGGAVVNIGSFATDRAQGAYGAAKAALASWNIFLARRLGPRGITANVVSPGFIGDTEFFGGRIAPEFVQARVAETMLGRVGEPDDVAGVVQFLASPAARHITGTVVHVNGGALTTR